MLSTLPPQQILTWALISLPNLYQTTAFGLSGLVILDMMSKITKELKRPPVPLIFLDTLYHFQETLDLATRASTKYSVPLLTYKPKDTPTVSAFESKHGPKLFETSPEIYDFLAKVEPAQRAYAELNVQAVITGRRRSQKGAREAIPILEIDSTGGGEEDQGVKNDGNGSRPSIIFKLNPLAYWNFDQVWNHIREHNVPYNPLIDKGYKSIGDWHSTKVPSSGDGERDGRWQGSQKTECGLHENYFEKRKAFLKAMKEKEEQEKLEKKRGLEEEKTDKGSEEVDSSRKKIKM
ncbi:hypothetical protein HK102_009214 [Quaeritorhiza haematococci]|nr:hypothetical protein HK102_009214 [Quaeritorhiza haematococci]